MYVTSTGFIQCCIQSGPRRHLSTHKHSRVVSPWMHRNFVCLPSARATSNACRLPMLPTAHTVPPASRRDSHPSSSICFISMSAASNSDQVSTFCLSDRDRDPRTRTRQNLVDPCQGKSVAIAFSTEMPKPDSGTGTLDSLLVRCLIVNDE